MSAGSDSILHVREEPQRLRIDTGAGLSVAVDRTNGDITSMIFQGVEYQHPKIGIQSRIRIASLPPSAIKSSISTVAIVTIETPAGHPVAPNLAHYLIVRQGENAIDMATYPSQEPAIGELRWIARLLADALPDGPQCSDVRNGRLIEAKDVFVPSDGMTRSKFYGSSKCRGKERAIDLTYTGVCGTTVGIWLVYDSPRESASGGPFYRDIQHQRRNYHRLCNYMNSAHYQTDGFRLKVLHGPYVLVFNEGSPPALPLDTAWIGRLGLRGWIPPEQREESPEASRAPAAQHPMSSAFGTHRRSIGPLRRAASLHRR